MGSELAADHLPSAMREAHVHLPALGESLSLLNLAACTSLAQALERVCDACDAAQRSSPPSPSPLTLPSNPGSSDGRACRGACSGACSGPRAAKSGSDGHSERPCVWVRGFGARPEGWSETRWMTLDELDHATGSVPTVLMSFDHHTAVANTAAMLAAGLRVGTRVGRHGVVESDKHGNATGLLHEEAAYAAWNSAPEPTMGQRRRDLLRALKLLGAMGFTEVHDLHSPAWLGPMLGELDRAAGGEALRTRCVLYAPIARLREDAASRHLWESERVRLGGGKVFADGTLNSRTAFLLHPYAHPDPHVGPLGKAMVTDTELDTHLTTCAALGLELAVHAIGDGAVRMALDACERFSQLSGQPTDKLLRIEHCELIDERDVERFAKLGVVCSVQPCHLLTDEPVLRREFSGGGGTPSRLSRVLPLRELIESGLEPGRSLLFGSDAPIVRPNPEDSIVAAVHRTSAARTFEPVAPEQAISEEVAWACFGMEPAPRPHAVCETKPGQRGTTPNDADPHVDPGGDTDAGEEWRA